MSRSSTRIALAVLVLVLAAVAAWAVLRLSSGAPPLVEGPPPSFAAPAAGTEVLVGAGDIARCDSDMDEATARLLDAIPGTVFTTGDNAYERGTAGEFERCYAPTWGRHLVRTRFPVAGNHDWGTAGAAGYTGYFGAAARPDGDTWYAAELGAWRVIVLDSDCAAVGGCDEGSPQLAWLRDELAKNAERCTLALWHHPRFSSGAHGDDEGVDAFWDALHEAGAEIVLNGHDHNYERFAPQDPSGAADPTAGIRQFVVGTGGTNLRDVEKARPNSEVRDDETHGVLRLELAASGYAWQFVPIAGRSFTDHGTGECH